MNQYGAGVPFPYQYGIGAPSLNTYQNLPQVPAAYTASSPPPVPGGAVPPQGPASNVNFYPGQFTNVGQIPMNFSYGPGGTVFEDPTQPGLQENLAAYLQTQIGQGLTPFNLATPLATGGSTLPGQVNAPLNPLLQNMQNFLQTGQAGSAPGLGILQQEAQTGMPINVTPEWQQMVNAMQIPIQQNMANLREQFASSGGLQGSEYGTALSNYLAQTTANQQALLGQLQVPALEQASSQQLSAAGTLTGLQSEIGQLFQGLNQQDIQNLMTEFMQTQPQYNPLLNLVFAQANAYAPIFSSSSGTGIIGSLIPAATGAISAGAGKAAQGGATAGQIIMAALAGM